MSEHWYTEFSHLLKSDCLTLWLWLWALWPMRLSLVQDQSYASGGGLSHKDRSDQPWSEEVRVSLIVKKDKWVGIIYNACETWGRMVPKMLALQKKKNVSTAKMWQRKWECSACSGGRLTCHISLEVKDYGGAILWDRIWECKFEGSE